MLFQNDSLAAHATADSIRAALTEVFARSDFNWEEPRRSWLAGLIEWIKEWFASQQLDHPLLVWTSFALLAAFLILIFSRYGARIWRSVQAAEGDRQTKAARIVIHDADWYRAGSARLRAEGRYAEALAYSFNALLLELETHKALDFHPSKTPAEYTREVKLDETGKRRFSDLVSDLYGHIFGGAVCTSDDVDAFEREALQLGAHVAAS